MLLSGCLAYRISGYSDSAFRNPQSPADGRKYRIARLDVDLAGSDSNPRFVLPTVFAMPMDSLIAAVQQRRPDVFSGDKRAIPIEVSVTVRQSHTEDGWSFLVYLCSIGCLPFWMDYISDCEVEVKFPDAKGTPMSAQMMLKYSMRMTCYTPFGGFPYSDDPQALTNQRDAPAYPGPDNAACLSAFADIVTRVIVGEVLRFEREKPSTECQERPSGVDESSRKDLEDLRKAGIISEEDYAKEKQK